MSAAGSGAASVREGIPLGKIAGVPIVLAYSWFLIAGFTVLVFGPQLSQGYPGLGFGAYGVAFVYALLLLFSVLIHELSHALAAKMYHWPTQKIVLNLWGGHTQFENFTATPGRSVVVAFAGPVANFVLAGLGWLLVAQLTMPTTLQAAVFSTLANIFVWANLLIGAFNVLPGLPLDGGRLVESIVWKATGNQDKGSLAAGWAGRIVVIVLLILAIGWPLINGDQPTVTNVLFSLFIAGFLWLGASASITSAKMRLRLPDVSAGKLSSYAVGMASSSSVAQVRAVTVANPQLSVVLCGPDGRPEAVVDPTAAAAVPEEVAAGTSATAVARALAPGAYIPEQAAGQELVQYLAQLAGSEYAVVDPRGQVTGLLHQSVVVAAITGRPGPGLRK
ncbi:site-2 protease family protein [Paenarthrobacter sp. Z7-10]|uniref:site-2 protease family protein n=1 Tax=Paenarthrobacter sp. Z7-10 TaxID=2787635 RepID=UPI0022A98651|nr:site-2 protease family protein [Paenarthrobacter sp. Z7-10]MCZ2404180.1 site-2 protease family protein [Paenarthrobacter sp. Z7-10]